MSFIVTIGVVVLILLMVTGVPVAFAFLGSASIMAIVGGYSTGFMVPYGFAKINSIILLAMPMFILAGSIMEFGGIGEKLVNAGNKLFGRIKGGLGILVIMACGIFGAISGSSTAALSCIGSILKAPLEEKKYPKPIVGALVANAAIIGILIPPSIIMVLFGWAGNISVLACFLATVMPGLLTMAIFCVITIFLLRKEDIQVVTKEELMAQSNHPKRDENGKRIWGSGPALVMPFLILGGIYTGLFTPTEAAAVSCIYAIPVGFFIYRELNAKTFYQAMAKAGLTSGVILITTFGTNILSRIFIDEKLPQILIDALLFVSEDKRIILVMVNLFLMIIGMLMSDTAATLLCTPILVPVMIGLGFDPVHFAAIFAVNIGFANVTPPCAPLLYLSGKVMDVDVKEMLRPNMWYLLAGWLPVLLVTTYFPDFSLFLPKLILGYGA